MTAFSKHQGDRIKGIFRKQLRPAENDGDESDGIQKVGNEPGSWALPQLGDHNRCAQGGQAHGDSTSQSGNEKADHRAIQLVTRIARNLLVDLIRCWPIQVGLDLGSRGGRRFGARIFCQLAQGHESSNLNFNPNSTAGTHRPGFPERDLIQDRSGFDAAARRRAANEFPGNEIEAAWMVHSSLRPGKEGLCCPEHLTLPTSIAFT